MLVVAGIAYDVEADSEDQAESKLLDYLSDNLAWDNEHQIIKMWVSAKQDDDARVADMNNKESKALNERGD